MLILLISSHVLPQSETVSESDSSELIFKFSAIDSTKVVSFEAVDGSFEAVDGSFEIEAVETIFEESKIFLVLKL